MSFTDNAVKASVEALRSYVFQNFGNKLKPTHAHEVFAAYANYKSKVALKADSFELDPDDPDGFAADSEAQMRIQARMANLNGFPVGTEFAYNAVKIIERAITPTCDFCHSSDIKTQAVGSEVVAPLLWACPTCAKEEPELGYCHYCGTDHLYHESLLNSSGECPDHAGESVCTEEEQEDLDSYAEYWINR